MRSLLNFILLATGLSVFLFACDKLDQLPTYNNGSSVTLTASKTSVVAAPADSTNPVINFTWTNPQYASDSSTYKYILEIDSTGRNFSKEVTKIITGKLNTSLTGKELNNIVLNYGFSLGVAYTLDVRVTSSYANNNERYTSNVVKIAVTPYTDPSVFSSTATTVTGSLATASQTALTFSWTPSFNGYNGAVTYTLQYDSSGKNFSSPHEMAVGAAIYSRAMMQSEMNQTAIDEGVTMGTTGKLEYRIKAVTAQGATAYSNAVAVTVNTYISILRFYLPGSYQSATGNGTDWDPPTAPELIRDQRTGAFNRLYYTYIYLPAGAQFKITQGRSWDKNYGTGSGTNTLAINGGNLTVSTAGVYRISIDVTNLKYDIKAGRMGFVGDAATNVGWDPSKVFPTAQMALLGNNKFLGVYIFSPGGWKMIDNDQWNNGTQAVDETRSYGSTSSVNGSSMVINADNFPNVAAKDTFRVIWDGTSPDNIKYEMYRGLRVVGLDPNIGNWMPDNALRMTYIGNGKWQATFTLSATSEFKFVSGDGWGFNYGGSGGSANSGTLARDGANLSKPKGTYTVTVDEYNQTYTIQ